MIVKYNLHREMKQKSIFRKYHKSLLMIGLIFILTSGAMGWMAAHPQEEEVMDNPALFQQYQVAGDTHSQPVHAQISTLQDYFNGVQVHKSKWLKHLPASEVSRDMQCLPLHRQYTSLYPMLFYWRKPPLHMLHCCYRI